MAIVAAGAAATACSLVTDLTGFSGDPAQVDAGTDGSNDGAPQADAGDGGASAGASGCASAAFADASFCVDFDRPGDFGNTVWTDGELDAAWGTIAPTTAFATSPPNSALFDLGTTPTDCTYLRLNRHLTGTFRSLRFRASMRPETEGVILNLDLHPTDAVTYGFLVSMADPTHVHVFVQKASGTAPNAADEMLEVETTLYEQWSTVTIDYTTDPAPAAKVTVGTASVSFALPADAIIRRPAIGIGPSCNGSNKRIAFDDVAVWLTP
jgi:hypothetical protein